MKTKTQRYPKNLNKEVLDEPVPFTAIARHSIGSVSSSMIPRAWMEKKRIDVDCYHGTPWATSLNSCIRPEIQKVKNRRVYRDISVPGARPSKVLVMKLAALVIFCR